MTNFVMQYPPPAGAAAEITLNPKTELSAPDPGALQENIGIQANTLAS